MIYAHFRVIDLLTLVHMLCRSESCVTDSCLLLSGAQSCWDFNGSNLLGVLCECP
jgi:hypothetical protein